MALTGRPLTIFGDGLQTRDFVFVSDVVEAYCAAALHEDISKNTEGGVYNVGSGQATSILELARWICRLTGCSESITFGSERPGDIRHSRASIEAISNALGWGPRVGLEEGLKQTIRWLRGAV